MDANEFKVTDVLVRNERFVVPLYQRQYQWHDSRDGNRTSAFWHDVAAKAGDVLDGHAKFEHYMGALLLAPGTGSRSFGMTPVVQVVDGQQRLTTFLILLSAIREVAILRGFDDIADECRKYLFNEPGKSDTDDLVRFKLTPTPVDREVFLDIIDRPLNEIRDKYRAKSAYWGGGVPKNTKFRALRAYEFFIAQVTDFIATGPGDDSEIDIDEHHNPNNSTNADNRNLQAGDDSAAAFKRLNALLESLVFHLKLIVITLDEKDDAQVIFETLNSAGQPLLAMDLVRNNIFHRAEAEHEDKDQARNIAEQLYKDIWEPFDDGWWRDSAPNARPQRPRIDHFLSHVLTAETGERITVRELYAEYRKWATPNRMPRFAAVADELAVLQKHAPTYEILEDRRTGSGVIGWLGRRLHVWQQTTAYPLAFQLASDDVDCHTRSAVAKLLDSYLTRRALCGLTPKNLNRLFPRLANAFRRNGVSGETMAGFFEEMNGPATKFPDDAEVKISIVQTPIYGRIPSRILSDILWNLELASRSSKTEATKRPDLWIEHIMPRAWERHWPLKNEEGEAVGQDSARYWERQMAVGTLGNLTIVTDGLNRSLGHLEFGEKKAKLVEYSNLTLNRRIAEADDWNEGAIAKRGEALAVLACDIWPTPAKLV